MITGSDITANKRDGIFDRMMGDILMRWSTIYDHAKFLTVEHQLKDKEYGIKWRLQFLEKLKPEAEEIIRFMGNEDQRQVYEAVVSSTDPKKIKPHLNNAKVLADYLMDGDLKLINIIMKNLVTKFKQTKRDAESNKVLDVLDNLGCLAMFEVSVTYLK